MKNLSICFIFLSMTIALSGQNVVIASKLGKYVAVQSGDVSNSTPIVMWEDECQADLVWTLIRTQGSSNVKIKNVKSGKFLAVASAGTANGSKIVLFDDRGQRDILWITEPSTASSYVRIKNINSSKYLAIESGSTANGAQLVLWTNNNQQDVNWIIDDLSLLDVSLPLYIINCNSNLHMQAPNYNTDYSNLVQSGENATAYFSHWIIERIGRGPYYKIKYLDKYIGVGNASNDAGAHIVITPDWGQLDIQWEIIRVGPLGVKFKNRQSGLFIGVEGASTQSAARLVQWRDEGQKDIIWKTQFFIP